MFLSPVNACPILAGGMFFALSSLVTQSRMARWISNYPAIQVTSSMTDMSVEGVVQAAGGLLRVPYMKRVKGVLTIPLDLPLNLP